MLSIRESFKLATACSQFAVRFLAAKELRFGSDARLAMLQGADAVANCVQTTLGPKGRNVVIEQSYGPPKITSDGVTVAKAIDFKDKFKNMGAQLIKQASSQTNDKCGDGTTTSAVLARAIFREGCKAVAAGMNPLDLRRGINIATEAIIKNLDKAAKKVTSPEEILQVATISAGGDKEIGQLIANAMAKVGKEGAITVADGKTMKDELEVVEGFKFDRGFISPYFITDVTGQKIEMTNPYILITDQKLADVNSVIKAMEIAASERRELLIVCDDCEGEALTTLIINKLQGKIKAAAVKAPGFGDSRKQYLQDIATLTNATVMSEELGQKLDALTLTKAHLGSCKRVVITKDDTVVMEGKGDAKAVKERVEMIQGQLAKTESSWEKEKMEERIAKLAGRVAVLHVGGHSEVVMSERKDRVVDALSATRAAVEQGIVAGGGIALLYAQQPLASLKLANFDQEVGVRIVTTAVKVPCHTIVQNAGGEGAVVVGNLLAHAKGDVAHRWGVDYHQKTGEGVYCDLVQAGIIDPVKVVKTALSDASSIAGLMATTETMIVDEPEDEKKKMAMGAPYQGGAPAGGFDE